MVLHVHKRFTRAKAKFIFRIIVLRKFQTQLRKRWERGSLMGNLRADHRIISLLFLWCRRSARHEVGKIKFNLYFFEMTTHVTPSLSVNQSNSISHQWQWRQCLAWRLICRRYYVQWKDYNSLGIF